MKIVVEQDPATRHHGTLHIDGHQLACAIGRGGMTASKREGDGGTPVGRFPLREVRFRNDRIGTLASGLPIRASTPDDGWCDDPTDPRYNRAVALPINASAETLWRDDALYDVVVVIGYNDDPPEAGRGSAIFLHVAGAGLAATEGCVALPRDVLIELVARLAPGDEIEIRGAAQ
jgi:L,D-peptidoglycan transpeptidase YkuD (ErfK/YbiS/YcfS/YnhG family)